MSGTLKPRTPPAADPVDLTTRQEQAEADHGVAEHLIGIAEYSPWGRLTRASPRFLAMFGYGADEVHDFDHREFCPAETAGSDSYTHLWIQLRAGDTRRMKERRMAKGRRDVWLDTTYVPIRDHLGQVRSVIEFTRDITEDSARFRALKQTVVAASTVFGIVEFDPLGMIRDFNEGFLRMIGHSARSLQDQHHSILCPTDGTALQDYHDFWQALSKGETRTGYFTLLGHLGREIVVIGSYLPIRSRGGSIARIMFFAVEVTTLVNLRKPERTSYETASADVRAMGAGPAEGMRFDALEEAIARTQDTMATGKATVAAALGEVRGAETALGSIRETVDRVSETVARTSKLAVRAASETARVDGNCEGAPIAAHGARQLVERKAGTRDIMVRVRAIADRMVREASGSPIATAALDASARHLTDAVSRVQLLVAASVAQAEKVNQTADVLRDLSEDAKA